MNTPNRKPESLSVSGPARIHFGMFSVDESSSLRFGGMGLMVQRPATIVRCRPATRLGIEGLYQPLARRIVDRWFENFGQQATGLSRADDLPLLVEIHTMAARHSGLGTGTQVALAISLALFHSMNAVTPPIDQLAIALNRGHRSAIGTYGFFHGGCLVDYGKSSNDRLSPLETRMEFPEQWRIVLIRPNSQTAMHGAQEMKAFQALKKRSRTNRERMLRLCHDHLIPAIESGDYEAMGSSLYDFNRFSGEYYSEHQQGIYNGQHLAQIVSAVRDFGIEAVGQSSWGPCIFCIARNDEQALALVAELRNQLPDLCSRVDSEIIITEADNQGFKITVSDDTVCLPQS